MLNHIYFSEKILKIIFWEVQILKISPIAMQL